MATKMLRRLLCLLLGHHYRVAILSAREPMRGVIVCTCCGVRHE